jgi:hypothetical protein
MIPMIHKNSNLSTTLVRVLPDRTAKAVAWTVMVVVCAAAHFEFMRLISPLTAAMAL